MGKIKLQSKSYIIFPTFSSLEKIYNKNNLVHLQCYFIFFHRTGRAQRALSASVRHDVIAPLESAAPAVTSSRFFSKQYSGKSHVDDPGSSGVQNSLPD